MTLAELLQEKLSSWRPATDGQHSLTESFAEPGWTVTLTADRTDTIGTVAWELSLARNAEPPVGQQEIRRPHYAPCPAVYLPNFHFAFFRDSV